MGVALDILARDAHSTLTHTFDAPLTLAVRYDPAALTISPTALVLYTYELDSGTWGALPTTVDLVAHLLIAPVAHLSLFAGRASRQASGAPPIATATATTGPTDTPAPTNTPVVLVVDVPASGAPSPPLRVIIAATGTPVPPAHPVATYTPAPRPTAAPSPTTIITMTRRYTDRTRVHIHEITCLRVRDVTRVHVRLFTRTVVRHHVVYVTRYRTVTRVRMVPRAVLVHKTIVRTATRYRTVTRYRYVRLPGTGRFAAPLAPPAPRLAAPPPPVEARVAIPRLGITWAPIWACDVLSTADGTLRYDIVPAYGATRFAPPARPGQRSLTLLSGHDDVYGRIFRYLGTLRRGDPIVVWQGARVYHYVVRLIRTVAPDDVRLLNATDARPALALVSCTLY